LTLYVPCPRPAKGPCPRMLQYEKECRRRDPAGRSLGIFNPRPVSGSHSWSLHACGRALDWRPSSRAAGDQLAAWLTGPTAPDDCQLVIWWGREFGGRTGKFWRPYHGADNHHGHLHIETNVCQAL